LTPDPDPYLVHRQSAVDLAGRLDEGILRLRVQGDSMRPWLRRMDVIVVEPVTAQHLRLGDVIVLRGKASFLTHRLIGMDRARLVTKGDALWLEDPVQDVNALVGRVSLVERNTKPVWDFSSPGWRLIHPWLGRVHGWIARAVRAVQRLRRRWLGL